MEKTIVDKIEKCCCTAEKHLNNIKDNENSYIDHEVS